MAVVTSTSQPTVLPNTEGDCRLLLPHLLWPYSHQESRKQSHRLFAPLINKLKGCTLTVKLGICQLFVLDVVKQGPAMQLRLALNSPPCSLSLLSTDVTGEHSTIHSFLGVCNQSLAVRRAARDLRSKKSGARCDSILTLGLEKLPLDWAQSEV